MNDNGDAGARVSLTGVWDGLYSYPANLQAATPFTATLLETGDAVGGTVHEIGQAGPDTGLRIHAMLDGRRMGQLVVLTKTYDVAAGSHYSAPVIYEGAVSEDGQEIEGRWSIHRVWSGKFLMVRAGRTTAAARRVAFAKV